MTDTKDFSTAAIASLSSGILLCDFSKMHEAAEWLMGHPIWTHQFASEDLCRDMRAFIAEQCPGMPMRDDNTVTKENWREYLAKLEAELGTTVRIRSGGGLTSMLPTDGIPDHLKDKIIVVQTP